MSLRCETAAPSPAQWLHWTPAPHLYSNQPPTILVLFYYYNRAPTQLQGVWGSVSAEGNGDLQTLICVLVARPRRCLTLSNPVPWQNWMAAYLGYTLWMKTLFRGWPVMVHDTHTRRRRLNFNNKLPWLFVDPCCKPGRLRCDNYGFR